MLSTAYRSGIEGKLDAACPAAARHTAGESIEATLGVAAKLGPRGRAAGRRGQRRLPARDARHRARRGGVALIGAVVVAVFLPGRAPAPGKPGQGEPDRAGRPAQEPAHRS